MAFNSNSYHANKSARRAWEYLAEARAMRERQQQGTARSWERPVEDSVKLARSHMRSALFYRRMRQLQRERIGR